MKKNFLGILATIAILLLVFGCVSVENTKKPFETKTNAAQTTASPTPTETQTTKTQTDTKTTSTTTPTSVDKKTGTGKIVFAVADEAVALKDVQSVKVTFSAVSAHRKGDEWKVLSTTPVTQDVYLLKKNGQIGLLAEIELEEGVYDQIRLVVSSVKITTRMGEEKNAEVPSNVLQLKGDLEVVKGKTSSAVADFNLDKSIHKTGLGRLLFIPVIKFETKTDVAAGVSGSTVEFSGGTILASKNFGMNVDGETTEDYELNPAVELKFVEGKISEGSQTKVEPKLISKGTSVAVSQTLQSASQEKVLGRYSRN